MRRVAAILAFIAVSQSVLLGTRLLCNGAELEGEAMADMPDMDASGTPATDAPAQGDRDLHHVGAHCPLMASCLAPALRSVPAVVRPVAVARGFIVNAPIDTLRSEKAAPEPPPPKS